MTIASPTANFVQKNRSGWIGRDRQNPLIGALTSAIRTVTGRGASLVASPGTYDQKHVARIAGVPHCVAYGPGELAMAHQPDEYCSVDDIISCTKVLALAVMELSQ